MADGYASFVKIFGSGAELAGRFWSEAVSLGAVDLEAKSEVWLESLEEICQGLVHFLTTVDHSISFSPPQAGATIPPAAELLGSTMAKRLHQHGCSQEFFSFLLGLSRRCCQTLYVETGVAGEQLVQGIQAISNFFDLLTRGAVAGWLHAETRQLRRRLRQANYFILREKRRYFTIFNQMSEPALIVDAHRRIVDINHACEGFFGVVRQETIGKSCRTLLGSELYTDSGLEEALARHGSFANLEGEWRRGKECRHLLLAGTFLGEVNGQDAGGIVIVQDVSERRQYQRRLLESEEKYRSLVENVPDVVWRSDQEGNILFISPNVERILGYRQQEMQAAGRVGWLGKVFHQDVDQVACAYSRLFREGEPVDICYRFQRRDGVWVWLRERSGNRYLRDGRQIAEGVVADITKLKLVEEELEQHHLRLAEMVDLRTAELREVNAQLRQEIAERKQVEEELVSLTDRLRESNAELEQFAHVASHDMKEPLLLICAFAERLQKRYHDILDDAGREYLARLLQSARQLQQLIDDLLQLARVTTTAKPFERIDLGELLRNVVAHFEPRLQESKGQVQIHSLHTLNGDRMQIWQLFQNILGNALKYQREGIAPRVVVQSRTVAGRFCEISVADNGIGFDERYLERIFQPFERLHGRGRFEGTGIGLATCKKIVARHGGEITARSVEGSGSVFIVRLPIDRKRGADTDESAGRL